MAEALSRQPAPPILATEGLTKRFGGFTAVSGISLAFRAGELAAIIGPNGAGKSTFFNLITGAFPPTAGRILYQGRDITGLPQHRLAALGIAKSFQITSIFPQLPVLENVRIAAQARVTTFDFWRPRTARAELLEEAEGLLQQVGLHPLRARLAADLAHGEQRALEIAMALACRPRLLLLDEPTAGMSPEETTGMMDLILELAQARTVVLVEHKMKLVMRICDRLMVLHHGELLAEGKPAEIRANEAVRRVYLGKSADRL